MSWLVSRCVMWFRTNLAWSNSAAAWQERILAVGWLGAALLLLGFGGRLALATQAALWGLLILAGAYLLRSGTVQLFGPVLFYDLLCIARRGRYLLLRFCYAVILLLLLTSLYIVWDWRQPRGLRPSSNEITRFAETFYLLFMAAEFLVVLLLTPAYVAGALADEKDRGTLDYLLATDLSNREIVLSKLLARTANLAILVLTGLPILSLTQFFGGIDPNLVLTGFAALGVTMASLACLSILHSAYAVKPRDAIVMTYLTAAVYLGVSYLLGRWAAASPALMAQSLFGGETEGIWSLGTLVHAFTAGNLFTVLHQLIDSWNSGQPLSVLLPKLLRGYAVFHGMAAILCVAWATARLRIVAMKQGGRDSPRRKLSGLLRAYPPLSEAPLVWREVFVERGFRFHRAAKLIVAILVVISFAPALEALRDLVVDVATGRGAGPTWRAQLALTTNAWVQQVGTLVACLTLVGVAVRAAGCISSERDRDTLDGLLLTPLRRDEMLRGKWVGSILGMRWAWVWLAAIYAVGIATGGLNILAVPLLLVAWLVFATLAANIGIFFSITSKTSLRATIATFIALLAVCFGHWLLWTCLGPLFLFSSGNKSEFPEWVANFQLYGMTPPWTLRILAFQGGELQQPMYTSYRSMTPIWERFFCALVGLLCWGVISIGLGWINTGRFRREASGEPLHPSEFAGGAHPLSPETLPQVQTEPVAPAQGAVVLSEEHEVPVPMASPVGDAPALRGAVLVDEKSEDKSR